MKRVCFIPLLLLIVSVLLAPAPLPIQAQGTLTYAADLFSRTVNNHWGAAETGGPYTIPANAPDFDVSDSVGKITLASKNRAVYLAISALDVKSSVRVKTDKRPEGGTQSLLMFVRRTGPNTGYVARMRISPDGGVKVRAGKQIDGKITFMGTEASVPAVTHSPGKFLFLKMQVTGTNPSTVRVRSWALGQTEPATWNVTVNDSTPVLQQAGGFGLRVASSKKTTNRPFVFAFDDLKVTQADASDSDSAPGSIYWGALVNGAAPSPANLAAGGVFDTFEHRAQKKMSILHWGQPWKMNGNYLSFQTSYFTAVRNRGYLPLVDWGSFHLGKGVNQADFQLADIYNGQHDAYITQWAQDAKAWGHPFFLRFDWEMNGDWQFPWSEKLNGNKPGDYIKMWRHVHDIFKTQGVTNVTWVWCPNIAGSTTTSMASLYPGDAYVDWTCLDGYNKYDTWLGFNQVFGGDNIDWLHNSYKEITGLAPGKPLMIGETASLEAGDGGAKKAAWIKAALQDQLPNRFPKIKAVVWFNWDDNNAFTFPIESSSSAIQAFAEGIGSSYYTANNFANMNTSPIPPP